MEIVMKNKTVYFTVMICLAMTILLYGCGQSGAQYTIHLENNYNVEGEYDSLTVKSGKKIPEPEAPEREGYTFLGWYKDAGLTEKWDFAKDKVSSEMSLYAGWDVDTGDSIVYPENDKDFSSLRTPGSQESAYEYDLFFLPEMDGTNQTYVGDTMTY